MELSLKEIEYFYNVTKERVDILEDTIKNSESISDSMLSDLYFQMSLLSKLEFLKNLFMGD